MAFNEPALRAPFSEMPRNTRCLYQTVCGTPGAQQLNLPSNTKAKRLTWIERR